MNKPPVITSMNFSQSIVVNGRAITSLIDGEGYEARLLDFPWVIVWPKSTPEKARLTTVFNVRDADPHQIATAMVAQVEPPPPPPAKKKGADLKSVDKVPEPA